MDAGADPHRPAGPLLPILHKRRLDLIEHGGGNFEPRQYPGLLVKDGYWNWPDRELAGNAVDF